MMQKEDIKEGGGRRGAPLNERRRCNGDGPVTDRNYSSRDGARQKRKWSEKGGREVLVEEDGWTAGRRGQTGSVHKLRGGGKTERRAAPRDICSPRRVAPHLQRNKFASSAFDGSSYPPSGFRSLSLSLCPFAPARERAPPIFHPFENRRIGKN